MITGQIYTDLFYVKLHEYSGIFRTRNVEFYFRVSLLTVL